MRKVICRWDLFAHFVSSRHPPARELIYQVSHMCTLTALSGKKEKRIQIFLLLSALHVCCWHCNGKSQSAWGVSRRDRGYLTVTLRVFPCWPFLPCYFSATTTFSSVREDREHFFGGKQVCRGEMWTTFFLRHPKLSINSFSSVLFIRFCLISISTW